jgi:hypothetical protein
VFTRLLKACLGCAVDDMGDVGGQSDVKGLRDVTHHSVIALTYGVGKHGIVPPERAQSAGSLCL